MNKHWQSITDQPGQTKINPPGDPVRVVTRDNNGNVFEVRVQQLASAVPVGESLYKGYTLAELGASWERLSWTIVELDTQLSKSRAQLDALTVKSADVTNRMLDLERENKRLREYNDRQMKTICSYRQSEQDWADALNTEVRAHEATKDRVSEAISVDDFDLHDDCG